MRLSIVLSLLLLLAAGPSFALDCPPDEALNGGALIDGQIECIQHRLGALEGEVMLLGHHGTSAQNESDGGLTVSDGESTIYTVPAALNGHHNAGTTVDPYGIGFRFTIDDVSAGDTYLTGEGPAGESFVEVRVGSDGRMHVKVLAKAIGNVKTGFSSSGLIQSGVEYFVDIRSESVSVAKRNASVRVAGTSFNVNSTRNDFVSGDTRPIRVGGSQGRTVRALSMTDFYAFLYRPTDAQLTTLSALSGQPFRDAVTSGGGVNLSPVGL